MLLKRIKMGPPAFPDSMKPSRWRVCDAAQHGDPADPGITLDFSQTALQRGDGGPRQCEVLGPFLLLIYVRKEMNLDPYLTPYAKTNARQATDGLITSFVTQAGHFTE